MHRQLCLYHRKTKGESLDEEEGAEGQSVDAGAVEAADSAARVGDERFAKEVEGGVNEDGSGGGFAEFVEKFPEERVGVAFDGVNADGIAVKGEALEAGNRLPESSERGHGEAIRRGVEEFVSAFGGNGKGKGMKFLAMLDELIDVFDHVFGEG